MLSAHGMPISALARAESVSHKVSHTSADAASNRCIIPTRHAVPVVHKQRLITAYVSTQLQQPDIRVYWMML
jgi:hypothetical protein